MSKEELVDAPPMLLTTGDTGRLQEVTQLDLDEPFKTLGIQKTVSGNQTTQITAMKRKSDAYTLGILSVAVNHFEAWTGLFTIWFGQMNYPLSAPSLSEAQCKVSSHAQSTRCSQSAALTAKCHKPSPSALHGS